MPPKEIEDIMKPTNSQQEKPLLKIRDACSKFLTHIALIELSPFTQHSYTRVLKQFVAFAPEHIANITAEHIERFILTEREGYRASTCNLHLMAFKSWFTWLEEMYGLPNVARKVKQLRTLPPKQRILNREEYIKITNGKYKSRFIVMFLCNTGLRATEFLNLTKESINGQFLTVIGKGQKQRSIPLNQVVKTIIKSYPSLFNLINHRNRNWLYHVCQREAKRANIEPFSPHSCRHYFCTELVNRGVPLIKVSKMLGHASITTTEKIYTHLSDSDFLGTTDVLDK